MENIPSVLQEYKKETTKIQKKCILIVNVKEKLSDLVSRRLRELDLKKADLAKLTGLSRSYIGNMANGTAPTESGQYEPSPDAVEALAKYLQISEDEILNAIGYANNTPKIPQRIAIAGFEGLDEQDIEEIAQIMEMKKQLKKKLQNGKGEG